MNTADLDKKHSALKMQVQRLSAKVAPAMVAMGLVQEAIGLNQALIEHCEEVRNELKKRDENPNPNG